MALINCPECNKEISDKAVSCPNCGYPLSLARSEQDKAAKPSNEREKSTEKDSILETFYCYKCGTISRGVDVCLNCLFPLKFYRDGDEVSYEDIANGTVELGKKEINIARRERQSSKPWECFYCKYKAKGLKNGNSWGLGWDACPKCLSPLIIKSEGKYLSNKDIANGKGKEPTELEIRIAFMNSMLIHTANAGKGEYVADNNGNIVFKKYQTDVDKLRSELAEFRSEANAKAKAEKDKANKIPWTLAGFLGAEIARGLKNKK